jgi:type II secretory pathway component PulK
MRIDRRIQHRRGSVIVIVIWSVAIAAVIVGAAQVLAFRQAAMGRESIAKVEARWAARAGIEETLAVLEYHTEEPDASTARQLYKDLELVADGQLESGDWQIRHVEDGVEIRGPQDEHAKLNINNIDRATLLELDSMTMDVADAIVDWRDTDDTAGMMGAEYEFYVNRDLGYEPRNAPFRSIAELELVAGAFPKYVRGEDQNLNGRLDPNENDGGASEPPDDADGFLDAGWSGALTARSSGSLIGATGTARLNLREATPEEMQERFGVTAEQAAALAGFAKGQSAKLEMLLTQDLATLSAGGGNTRGGQAGGMPGGRAAGRGNDNQNQNQGQTASGRQSGRSSSGAPSGQAGNSRIQSLDQQQLRRIFQEGTLETGAQPILGKVNLNTAPPAVLRALLPDDPISADAILSLRNASSSGLLAISDLLGSSRITPQSLAAIAPYADTQSYVFTVTSRGRSATTGLEVEITAVIDRSTLPARILEYREQ